MAINLSPKIVMTSIGEQLRKPAVVPGGEPLHLKYIAVGDGSGVSLGMPELDKEQKTLYSEVWRDTIISIQVLDGANSGKFLVTGFIPSHEINLTYLKEFGLFTPNNELVYVGHLDNFFKPSVNTGQPISVIVQVEIDWGFTYGLALDENLKYAYATKAELLQEYDPLTARTISKPYLYYMSQLIRHSE